jgi:hypothetical protein
MPNNPPMLITRVQVGTGPGMVLVSFASPSGELGAGPVENVEAMRVAMTESTFKEVAELFARTAAELQGGAALNQGVIRPPLHVLRDRLKN